MSNSVKFATCCLVLMLPAILAGAADPFYTSLLNEGKQQYLAGDLDRALESFRIAEFGLLDEREYVPELYFFYSLAQYKKGQIGESQALLDKMKSILGEAGYGKARRPKEIEADLAIMIRSLDYLSLPGATPGMLPFLNLYYETWELMKEKKLVEAEAKLKLLGKMQGDEKRRNFLEGLLAFEKGDYKKCLSRLAKIGLPLPAEFGEEAAFCLAFSHLKRGNQAEADKFAKATKNPEYVHRLMALLEEIEAAPKEKRKNSEK